MGFVVLEALTADFISTDDPCAGSTNGEQEIVAQELAAS
jgi:hypothetical protein